MLVHMTDSRHLRSFTLGCGRYPSNPLRDARPIQESEGPAFDCRRSRIGLAAVVQLKTT